MPPIEVSTAHRPGADGPTCPPQPPGWPIRFDETTLWPGVPGQRLNPSLLADGDGYLFAVRTRWWASDILIGRLDAAFRPVGPPQRLALEHPEADTAREDPRLFHYRGQPHISFTGLKRVGRAPTQNQLYARLSADGMQVEEVFAPHYPARQRWEKNWSFFDHDGELFAVYSFAPCRILIIDGNATTLAYEAPTASLWRGGEIRGGAAPVRVGDELWCFTHDRIADGVRWVYRTGLVVLDGEPPFAVRRMLDRALLSADRGTRPVNHYASVVFACGAVRRDDSWVVAHGVHDRWCELHSFSHAELDERLVAVPR
ncbi:MAG TPA: hypothetical protein VGF55_20720 [Gemmataceae bacterium]|jgi:predicted GH43/DUF377 family glycosyl hydrolase